VLAAQSQSGNIRDSVMTPTIGAPQSIAEQFVSQLRIDPKDQGAAVDEILIGATRAGAPIGKEITQARVEMLNGYIRKDTALQQSGQADYAAAAMKMAALEVEAFKKVHALLKQNQLSREPQAFTLMAGIFLPALPPAPRAPQGPRTGR
jgi:hypothetical protein